MPSLKVLRELDPVKTSKALYEHLTDPRLPADDKRRLMEITEPRRKGVPERERWLVENDIPRVAEITREIIDATAGFVIVDDDGNIIRETTSLKRAEEAVASARFTISIATDLDDDVFEEHEAVEG